MANQAGYFNIQEFTAAGDYLVGGRVYTYIYGTTTHKLAYTDADGLVPQTYVSDGIGGLYIALDARGELPAPLYLTEGAYDIALKTAAGATIWTRRADPAGSSSFSTPVTFTSTVTFEDNVTFEENVTIEGDLTVEGNSFHEGTETFNNVIIEGDLSFTDGATVTNFPDNVIDINNLTEELTNIILNSGGGGAGVISGDGRLSLSATEKTMVVDYTAITTIYYVGGTVVSYNDGTDTFRPFTIGTVLSNTLADNTYSPAASAANKAYDGIFWVRSIVVASITQAAGTATVTTTGNHGITTGAVVLIAGCDQPEYNGYQTLLSGSGTTFTFTVDSGAVTPATGSITCKTGQLSKSVAWRNRGQVISDVTEATPAVVTATAHGLVTGDIAYVSNLVGITGVPNAYYTVTVLTADTFSLGGTTAGGTYIANTGSFAARGEGAGTASITLNGSTWVNTVAVTNGPGAGLGTVLGSFMTDSSNQLKWLLGGAAAGGSPSWLSVDNISNEVPTLPAVLDSTASWTYNSNTARKLNNNANNRCTFIQCLPTKTVVFRVNSSGEPQPSNSTAVLLGLDSEAIQAPNSIVGNGATGTNNTINFPIASYYQGNAGMGVHYIQGLEVIGGVISNPSTFYGASTGYTTVTLYATGIFGTLQM